MKKRFFLIVLFSVCFFGLSVVQNSEATLETVDELVMQDKVNEAKTLLDQFYANDKNSYDVLWRMSRLEILIGDQKEGQDSQLGHYEQALEYANRAIKANKKGTLGYVRRAAANGKLALFQGVLTSTSYVNAVRDDCEKAIKYNSDGDYNLAAAYYILGRTHLKLYETPVVLRMPLDLDWGNLDEAVEYLEKAVELRPGFLWYQLDYARALIEFEEEKKAKKLLTAIADMEFQEPGDDARKAEAAELLKSL